MDWDYLRLVGAVGGFTLVLLIVWDRWTARDWEGLRTPTPLWLLLIEWAIYMSVFLMLSLVVQIAWHFTCSICG